MKHLIAIKSFAAVALTFGAIAAASSAHASSDVRFTIGVQVPGFYAQPMPVYVQPRAAYLPVPVEYGYFDDHRRFRGHHWQGSSPYRDFDRDGIVNRYDRQPDNPYRR